MVMLPTEENLQGGGPNDLTPWEIPPSGNSPQHPGSRDFLPNADSQKSDTGTTDDDTPSRSSSKHSGSSVSEYQRPINRGATRKANTFKPPRKTEEEKREKESQKKEAVEEMLRRAKERREEQHRRRRRRQRLIKQRQQQEELRGKKAEAHRSWCVGVLQMYCRTVESLRLYQERVDAYWYQSNAALRIQKLVRGYFGRQLAYQARISRQAYRLAFFNVRSVVRKKLTRRQQAAINIQRLIRGHLARITKRQLQEVVAATVKEERISRATRTLQAFARKCAAMKSAWNEKTNRILHDERLLLSRLEGIERRALQREQWSVLRSVVTHGVPRLTRVLLPHLAPIHTHQSHPEALQLLTDRDEEPELDLYIRAYLADRALLEAGTLPRLRQLLGPAIPAAPEPVQNLPTEEVECPDGFEEAEAEAEECLQTERMARGAVVREWRAEYRLLMDHEAFHRQYTALYSVTETQFSDQHLGYWVEWLEEVNFYKPIELELSVPTQRKMEWLLTKEFEGRHYFEKLQVGAWSDVTEKAANGLRGAKEAEAERRSRVNWRFYALYGENAEPLRILIPPPTQAGSGSDEEEDGTGTPSSPHSTAASVQSSTSTRSRGADRFGRRHVAKYDVHTGDTYYVRRYLPSLLSHYATVRSVGADGSAASVISFHSSTRFSGDRQSSISTGMSERGSTAFSSRRPSSAGRSSLGAVSRTGSVRNDSSRTPISRRPLGDSPPRVASPLGGVFPSFSELMPPLPGLSPRSGGGFDFAARRLQSLVPPKAPFQPRPPLTGGQGGGRPPSMHLAPGSLGPAPPTAPRASQGLPLPPPRRGLARVGSLFSLNAEVSLLRGAAPGNIPLAT